MSLTGRNPLGLKGPTPVSKAIRDFARGQECALQMPWCTRDPETVVHCHVRMSGIVGIGQKPPDFMGYHGCAECHRREKEAGNDDILRALLITQHRLWFAGILRMT